MLSYSNWGLYDRKFNMAPVRNIELTATIKAKRLRKQSGTRQIV